MGERNEWDQNVTPVDLHPFDPDPNLAPSISMTEDTTENTTGISTNNRKRTIGGVSFGSDSAYGYTGNDAGSSISQPPTKRHRTGKYTGSRSLISPEAPVQTYNDGYDPDYFDRELENPLETFAEFQEILRREGERTFDRKQPPIRADTSIFQPPTKRYRTGTHTDTRSLISSEAPLQTDNDGYGHDYFNPEFEPLQTFAEFKRKLARKERLSDLEQPPVREKAVRCGRKALTRETESPQFKPSQQEDPTAKMQAESKFNGAGTHGNNITIPRQEQDQVRDDGFNNWSLLSIAPKGVPFGTGIRASTGPRILPIPRSMGGGVEED